MEKPTISRPHGHALPAAPVAPAAPAWPWGPAVARALHPADRVCLCLDHPGGLQNHPRLRTPPPPLSHAHTPNQHHAASINSLNRGNFTPRSNPSPAPTDPSLSGEPPAGGVPEPAHAQDNWLLNSNIPLETRCGAGGRTGRATGATGPLLGGRGEGPHLPGLDGWRPGAARRGGSLAGWERREGSGGGAWGRKSGRLGIQQP